MSLSQTLELPQLSGGRRRAAALIAAAALPSRLDGAAVTVEGRQLRAGTESFADELVRTILVDRGAEKLIVLNVTSLFADYLRSAGRTHAVSERLQVQVASA